MDASSVCGAVPSKGKILTGRVLTGLAVAFFLFDAIMKIMKPASVVKATVEMGFPENTIAGMGVALLVCTLLYAIPRTSFIGAILLTGFLGGAVAAQVRVSTPIYWNLFPILFAVLVWAALALRDERLWALIFNCRNSARP